jgi:hypothetical protein
MRGVSVPAFGVSYGIGRPDNAGWPVRLRQSRPASRRPTGVTSAVAGLTLAAAPAYRWWVATASSSVACPQNPTGDMSVCRQISCG